MMEKGLPANYEETEDAIVEDALRTAPLAAPPPLLYAAIMHQVRQTAGSAAAPSAKTSFRVAWLDLALSLFFAGMAGVTWFALRAIPPVWISYFRNQALWSLQKVFYLDAGLLVWLVVGLALGALAACIGAMLAESTLKVFRDL